MHDPILDEVFDAIEDGSPLAEAVESLLEDGLAVDEAALDAATQALMVRLDAPKRRWSVVTLALLPLAAALAVQTSARSLCSTPSTSPRCPPPSSRGPLVAS